MGGPIGSGVRLSYSFPDGDGYHSNNYGKARGCPVHDHAERTRASYLSWASTPGRRFPEISFYRTVDTSSTVGDLRFAKTDIVDQNEARMPILQAMPRRLVMLVPALEWHDGADDPIKPGSYDYLVILHEIGYAPAKALVRRPEPDSDRPMTCSER